MIRADPTILEMATEVEDALITLVQEWVVPRFKGEHATTQLLRALSESVTAKVWHACPWGRGHFRFEAELDANHTLDFIFMPMSELGRQMRDALRAARTDDWDEA